MRNFIKKKKTTRLIMRVEYSYMCEVYVYDVEVYGYYDEVINIHTFSKVLPRWCDDTYIDQKSLIFFM